MNMHKEEDGLTPKKVRWAQTHCKSSLRAQSSFWQMRQVGIIYSLYFKVWTRLHTLTVISAVLLITARPKFTA